MHTHTVAAFSFLDFFYTVRLYGQSFLFYFVRIFFISLH